MFEARRCFVVVGAIKKAFFHGTDFTGAGMARPMPDFSFGIGFKINAVFLRFGS